MELSPSHAHMLVKEGIRSIEDLEKNKEKLTHHQQIGLKYKLLLFSIFEMIFVNYIYFIVEDI